MYKLAVIGNPIEHSLSPVVFGLFARQFMLELSYIKILAIDEADFKAQVTDFFCQGGLALNVTSPFKNQAYQIASMHTSRSAFCHAANFLRSCPEGLIADTTDGIGLVQDVINNKKFDLANKNVLIIGSGYVLDSILLDIVMHNPCHINILARNKERIEYLTNRFGIADYEPKRGYDIILNTTPNSSENTLFSLIKTLVDGSLCYDLTYNKKSIFLQQMKLINPTISGFNGLGMLVEQAKVAFTQLFNYQPDTALTLRQLALMGHI